MSLKTVLSYASFIPWILYFIEIMLYRIGVIEIFDLDQKKYLEHINKHLFSSINIKELILLFIFLIFMQAKNGTVLEILFPAIYLYLLIDFFQGLAENCKKIRHKSLMVQSVILVILTILFFMFTGNINVTYIMMFTFSIISSFLMYIFSLVLKFFKRGSL